MFENVGAKIRGMAKFFCWAGIILSIIIGIFLISNSSRYQDLTIQGIVVLIAGPICSWLGSLVTYGFGELIERAKSIDEKLSNPEYYPEYDSDDTTQKSERYDDLPEL